MVVPDRCSKDCELVTRGFGTDLAALVFGELGYPLCSSPRNVIAAVPTINLGEGFIAPPPNDVVRHIGDPCRGGSCGSMLLKVACHDLGDEKLIGLVCSAWR